MVSFLRRLFGSKKASSPAPASPTVHLASSRASRAISVVATDAVTSTGAAAVTDTAAQPIELLQTLRARLELALHRLDEELIGEHHRSADTAQLMRALRDDPLTNIRQLPVAAQRALSLLHGDAPTSLLVATFERDPAMTQALLHQVNSVYYNPNGARILSLTDAIGRMGRAGVQGVVLQQSVAGMVSRPGGELDAMAQKVWNHMVRVAPLARQLAGAFGVAADQAFLLGLLHDVGKLVVFDRITELRSAKRRTLSIDRDVVGRALRLMHEPLGGLVIQQWGLDGEIAQAVATHHREPAPQERDLLCEAIFVAERVDLAREQKTEIDLDALWAAGQLTAKRPAVADALGLSPSNEAAA
ncbi:MAG: HDOD domain-containing protein [Gemmatimonadaceae bacterium]